MAWWRRDDRRERSDEPGELCWYCRGDGVAEEIERDRDGRDTYVRVTCRYCRGTGRLD